MILAIKVKEILVRIYGVLNLPIDEGRNRSKVKDFYEKAITEEDLMKKMKNNYYNEIFNTGLINKIHLSN